MKIDEDMMIEIRHNRKFPRDETIPKKPGIYSWYYDFDRLIDVINNRELLIEEMVEISKKLCRPSLQGDLKGHLGTIYEAQMENVDFIELTDEKKQMLHEMKREDLKAILTILNKFSSPLYIGLASDLKTRYLDHINDYKRAKDLAEKEEKIKDVFGTRLFQMNIEPNELIFKYRILEKFHRNHIGALEHISNRLFKPIAGRR